MLCANYAPFEATLRLPWSYPEATLKLLPGSGAGLPELALLGYSAVSHRAEGTLRRNSERASVWGQKMGYTALGWAQDKFLQQPRQARIEAPFVDGEYIPVHIASTLVPNPDLRGNAVAFRPTACLIPAQGIRPGSGLWQKSVSVVEEQILPLSAWADSFD